VGAGNIEVQGMIHQVKTRDDPKGINSPGRDPTKEKRKPDTEKRETSEILRWYKGFCAKGCSNQEKRIRRRGN